MKQKIYQKGGIILNNLPIRAPQHVQETQSKNIFESFISKVFPKWIIREFNENDYGIDYQIEMVFDDDRVSGQIFSVQLKAKESIKWGKKRKCSVTIKRSTFNYWMNRDEPVYIFLVDTTTKNMYYCNAKQFLRSNYQKFMKKETETKSFVVNRLSSLSSKKGKEVFLLNLVLEKKLLDTLQKLNQIYHQQLKVHKILYLMSNDKNSDFEQSAFELLELELEESDDLQDLHKVISYCDLLLSVCVIPHDNRYKLARQQIIKVKERLSYPKNLMKDEIEEFLGYIQMMEDLLMNEYAYHFGERELNYWREKIEFDALLDELFYRNSLKKEYGE